MKKDEFTNNKIYINLILYESYIYLYIIVGRYLIYV